MNDQQHSLRKFMPLIVIFSIIIAFVIVRQLFVGWNFDSAMYDFMAAFFIVFSLFKISNLRHFVTAYSMYDILAKRSTLYAYLYPFIELFLGMAYLIRWQLFTVNIITIVIMFISAIGVAQELSKKREIPCACLGMVFTIPMTYVTLFEDILMAAMALIMLVR